MITDPDSKEHFCFDYGGDDGETLVLVDDAESGMKVDNFAQFISAHLQLK